MSMEKARCRTPWWGRGIAIAGFLTTVLVGGTNVAWADTAQIQVQPTSGPGSTQVTVTGSGFSVGVNYQCPIWIRFIDAGGTSTQLATLPPSRSFQVQVVIPSNPAAGAGTVRAIQNWVTPHCAQPLHNATAGFTVTTAAPDFTISASPSSVSVSQGSSGTSTITTTVSGGFNSSVSLSASGLPSGVTAGFNPASIPAPGSGSSVMTLTASPTAAIGTFTVTVTGTGGSITHSTSVSLIVSSQLLGNPGFENGSSSPAPWVTTARINDTSAEPPHSGSWDAWLGGTGTTHTDSLYQDVTIPSGITSATLTFWMHIETADTGSSAHDLMKLQVRNTSNAVLATLATYSNLNAAPGYAQKSFDLTAYAGLTIRVYLQSKEDASLQTSFVVDDFALTSA